MALTSLQKAVFTAGAVVICGGAIWLLCRDGGDSIALRRRLFFGCCKKKESQRNKRDPRFHKDLARLRRESVPSPNAPLPGHQAYTEVFEKFIGHESSSRFLPPALRRFMIDGSIGEYDLESLIKVPTTLKTKEDYIQTIKDVCDKLRKKKPKALTRKTIEQLKRILADSRTVKRGITIRSPDMKSKRAKAFMKKWDPESFFTMEYGKHYEFALHGIPNEYLLNKIGREGLSKDKKERHMRGYGIYFAKSAGVCENAARQNEFTTWKYGTNDRDRNEKYCYFAITLVIKKNGNDCEPNDGNVTWLVCNKDVNMLVLKTIKVEKIAFARMLFEHYRDQPGFFDTLLWRDRKKLLKVKSAGCHCLW